MSTRARQALKQVFAGAEEGEDLIERPDVSKQAVVNTPAPKSAEQSVAEKSSPSDSSQQDSPGAGERVQKVFQHTS